MLLKVFKQIKELKKEIALLKDKNIALENDLENIKMINFNLDEENKKLHNELCELKEKKSFFNTYTKMTQEYIENNVDLVYKCLKDYDQDGFIYLKYVKEATNLSNKELTSYFYYEENLGYFEFIDGYDYSKYYFKLYFGEIIESKFIGPYEQLVYSTDFYETDEFKKFEREIKLKVINEILTFN